MTGQPAAERAQNQALIVARRKADERYADSPAGMLATAANLRHRAAEMTDDNDRDAMIRVAAGYEERAAQRGGQRRAAFSADRPAVASFP